MWNPPEKRRMSGRYDNTSQTFLSVIFLCRRIRIKDMFNFCQTDIKKLRTHMLATIFTPIILKKWYNIPKNLLKEVLGVLPCHHDIVHLSGKAHVCCIYVLNLNFQLIFFMSTKQPGFYLFSFYFNSPVNLRFSFIIRLYIF